MVAYVMMFIFILSVLMLSLTMPAAFIYRWKLKKARCKLIPGNKNSIVGGVIDFNELPGGKVKITAHVSGLSDGPHGFHIHEKPATIRGKVVRCDEAGPHFNPDDQFHGGPGDAQRHVGDLGNIMSEGGVAKLEIVDDKIALRGRNNIVGRSVVVHEKEDDLGTGGTIESLETGTSGTRLACGNIYELL